MVSQQKAGITDEAMTYNGPEKLILRQWRVFVTEKRMNEESIFTLSVTEVS